MPHISLPSLLHSTTQGAVSSDISRVMPPKPATMKSDQPFVLTMLTNQIKKCSGCGSQWSRSTRLYLRPHGKGLVSKQWSMAGRTSTITYKETVFFNTAHCINFHRILALSFQLLQQCQCHSRICFTGNLDLNYENYLVTNNNRTVIFIIILIGSS